MTTTTKANGEVIIYRIWSRVYLVKLTDSKQAIYWCTNVEKQVQFQAKYVGSKRTLEVANNIFKIYFLE